MQIHELPDVTAIGSGGYFATDNGSQTTKIDYDALAKAIIEQYSASTLAGVAQSVKAAVDGLDGNKLDLKAGTAIVKDTDVNTIQTPGTYFCSSASTAASLSNIPSQATAVGFRLDVARNGYNVDNYLTQTLVGIRYGLSFEYVRGMSVQGTWGEWQKTPTREEVDALNSNFGGMRMYMQNTNALSYSFTLSDKDNSRHSAGLFFGGTANGREFCYLLWINATSNLVTITKLYDGLSARVFEATYDASTKVLTIQRTDATESGDRIFGGIRLIIG